MKVVRWRYVLFEILSNLEVSEQELVSIIWKQIYALYGMVKGAKFGFKLLSFDSEQKIGIARISWRFLDEFRYVLATLNMQKKDLHVNEVLVSGTQAALKRKFANKKTWREYWSTLNKLKNDGGE
ncbi:MAG: Rpp14/Pop5 family protein [Candidatus Njordarchaeia archaeon]